MHVGLYLQMVSTSEKALEEAFTTVAERVFGARLPAVEAAEVARH